MRQNHSPSIAFEFRRPASIDARVLSFHFQKLNSTSYLQGQGSSSQRATALNPNERGFPFPTAKSISRRGLINLPKGLNPPFQVRAFGIPTEGYSLAYVRQRIRVKLGKFSLHIKDLEIWIKEESGSTDEPVVACSLSVTLDAGGPVVVERFSRNALDAFDHAMGVAGRLVRRILQRTNHR